MAKKSLPKRKSSTWIGLAFALAAAVVFGYYWHGRDGALKGGLEQQERQVRQEATEKGVAVPSHGEPVHRFSAEKPIPYTRGGNRSDGGQEGDFISKDSLSVVTSDIASRRFLERDEGEKRSKSNAADADQATFSERSTLAEARTGEDEPDYSDAQPPEVIAIQFNPQQVPPGANVSIYVRAIDNLSGVNSVSGQATSPSGTAVLPFGCQRSDSEGSFSGILAIPDSAETGRWYLTYLRVTDNAYNSKIYSENAPLLTKSYFEVLGSGSDNLPPEVTAVYFNPSEVYGGEQVEVTIEAQDDKSGVARISGVLMSPSKHARLSFSCQNVGEANRFYGQLTVPEDAETGHWTLEYLRAEDEAKNAKTFYRSNDPGMFDNAGVDVYTNSSDSQPPTLDNLMIYPTMVAYEETARIVVYASDDVSGINRISGRLQSPSGQAHIPFSCVYDQGSDEYVAEVVIPTNAEIGLWRVDYIHMTDNARNQINYVYQTNDLIQRAALEIMGQ